MSEHVKSTARNVIVLTQAGRRNDFLTSGHYEQIRTGRRGVCGHVTARFPFFVFCLVLAV